MITLTSCRRHRRHRRRLRLLRRRLRLLLRRRRQLAPDRHEPTRVDGDLIFTIVRFTLAFFLGFYVEYLKPYNYTPRI